MKNIFLLIVILLFYSCGTDQGEGKTYMLTLSNSSGHDIKIDSYSERREESKVIVLLNGEAITKEFNSPAPPSQEIYTYLNFFEGDSIVVTYNNEKRQSFIQVTNCNENGRNPLNTCLYRNTKQTFTFTRQDYENAFFCDDGKCE